MNTVNKLVNKLVNNKTYWVLNKKQVDNICFF